MRTETASNKNNIHHDHWTARKIILTATGVAGIVLATATVLSSLVVDSIKDARRLPIECVEAGAAVSFDQLPSISEKVCAVANIDGSVRLFEEEG
jgi:hypothetical protein